jgi:hypothetical protein
MSWGLYEPVGAVHPERGLGWSTRIRRERQVIDISQYKSISKSIFID